MIPERQGEPPGCGVNGNCAEGLAVAKICVRKGATLTSPMKLGKIIKSFFHFYNFVKKCSEGSVARHSENMQCAY